MSDDEVKDAMADGIDDSGRIQYIQISLVPLTGDNDGFSVRECDGGDWSTGVKQEILEAVKEEPDVLQVCVGLLEFYTLWSIKPQQLTVKLA